MRPKKKKKDLKMPLGDSHILPAADAEAREIADADEDACRDESGPCAVDAPSEIDAKEEDEGDHNDPHAEHHDEHGEAGIAGAAQRAASRNADGVEDLVYDAEAEEICRDADDFWVVGEGTGDGVSGKDDDDADTDEDADGKFHADVGGFFGSFGVICAEVLSGERCCGDRQGESRHEAEVHKDADDGVRGGGFFIEGTDIEAEEEPADMFDSPAQSDGQAEFEEGFDIVCRWACEAPGIELGVIFFIEDDEGVAERFDCLGEDCADGGACCAVCRDGTHAEDEDVGERDIGNDGNDGSDGGGFHVAQPAQIGEQCVTDEDEGRAIDAPAHVIESIVEDFGVCAHGGEQRADGRDDGEDGENT